MRVQRSMSSTVPRTAQKVGWVLMLVLVMIFVVRHAPYFTLDFTAPSIFAPQRLIYIAHAPMIITHIAASMLALTLGPFQFLSRLRRKRFLHVHRWMGRLYLAGVVVGSISGFYMAWLSFGGLAAHLSFASLAVWWLTTAVKAYRHIRAGEVDAHRRWMIRSYAMTFAAPTLRLWLLLFIFPLGVPYEEAFVAASWICWIWNVPAAEGLIRVSAPGRRKSERSTRVLVEPAVA
jgi:uncharacterized membrane protein